MFKAKRSPAADGDVCQAASEKRKKGIRAAVYILLFLVLVIVILSFLYARSQGAKKELEAALTEAEAQLQLRQDVEDALEAKNREQESLIESLQADLEGFLNIEETKPVITSDQITEQLSSISELVTQKYIYTRAARETSNKTWMWDWTMPFSDTSLLVMYDGEVKAGINFSAVKVEVNEEERSITVTLPRSTVVNNNIPQETIEVLEVKESLFNEITFSDYNEFIASQKPAAEERAIELGLLADADKEAQTIVKAFLNMIPGIETYKVSVVTEE